jgi:hypothetical protein
LLVASHVSGLTHDCVCPGQFSFNCVALPLIINELLLLGSHQLQIVLGTDKLISLPNDNVAAVKVDPDG